MKNKYFPDEEIDVDDLYFICYMMIKLRMPTPVFGMLTVIFCAIYSIVACILVYKFAPKTFKIRDQLDNLILVEKYCKNKFTKDSTYVMINKYEWCPCSV